MEDYAVGIRRQLHMYPEVGFDLPRTLALLRSELDKIGVAYTEQYGKSSIVATVNPEKDHFTIGVRADIDALPICEKNDVPYKSRIEGQMHACGHDAHTAVALTALRRIYEMRDSIRCRVKFIFQSAEEYDISGAKLMAEDGVMDDIDCIVSLHCDVNFPAGTIGLTPAEQSAVSDGFFLDFYGKSAHVAKQESGIDAVMMAVRAYTDIEFMVAKEFPAKTPIIFNVGSIHAGKANNVIPDRCTMFCSLRNFTEENSEKSVRRVKEIIECVAKSAGGRATFTPSKHYPILYNDETMTERVRAAAEKVVGADHIVPNGRGLGGEDFSYFTRLKPGCMFRLGTRNEERGIVSVGHTDTFDIDEAALEVGVRVFTQFILDNMGGIRF